VITRAAPLNVDSDSPSPDWLHAHIQHALEHLYDYVYLQDLPLADFTGKGGEGWNRGAALHRLLVETIERIKPPANTPAHNPLWRRYRYAFLRYIEAATVSQIVEELGISERQARRDNNRALEAIAGLLRERLGPLVPRDSRDDSAIPAGDDDAEEPADPASESARAPLEPAMPAATRLDEIVSSVVTTSRNLAAAKGVTIGVRTPTPPALVTLERTVVRQIVLTMVVGVVEIARPGDTIELAVTSESATATVVVTVPLATSHSTATRAGLDERLAFARKLGKPVGAIVADSRSEDGLRITLTVPGTPCLTVLLVDDNPGMLRLLKRYLSGSGYAVLEAQSASDAISIATDYQPDVITLDVMMPQRDGWEVLQTLRAQPRTRHIPVVVCSVLKERDLAESLGAAAVISKPITQEALLRSLARLRPDSGR